MEIVTIPQWIKEKAPISAGFCEIINDALKRNPNMTLAEFASEVNRGNITATERYLEEVERKQFGG